MAPQFQPDELKTCLLLASKTGIRKYDRAIHTLALSLASRATP
jgi:hypothetical protein